jgi:hypothetical protein
MTEETGSSPGCKSQVLGFKRMRPAIPVRTPAKKSAKKRKASDDESDTEDPKPKLVHKKKDPDEEKRLKRFRIKPPLSYLERLGRVTTQRMFLIDRSRASSKDSMHEEEVFDIAGTTGNVYQVLITKVPSCSCPDYMKGNQCKHIIYVSYIALLKVVS